MSGPTRRPTAVVATCVMFALGAGALTWLRAADPRTASLVFNTLCLALSVATIALPIGGLVAWALARVEFPGRRTLGAALGLLFFVPLFLQAAAWDAGFGLQGSVTLTWLGGETWLSGWPAVIWLHSLAAIPWVALAIGVGLHSVEPELEQAALLDLPHWRVAISITLRRAAPSVAMAFLGILLTIAAEMTITDLFRVRTIAEELYTAQALGDDGGLRGATFASIAATAWLVGLTLAWGARVAPPVRQSAARPHAPKSPTATRWAWTAFVALTVLMALGVPVACLLYKAGLIVEMQGTERIRHWSLFGALGVTWRSLFQFRAELGWSCASAALAATLSLVLGAPLAWCARRGGWRAWLVAAMAVAMLATPGPLLALGVLNTLSRPDPTWLVTIVALLGFSGSDGLLTWLRDQPLNCLAIVQLWRALPWAIGIAWYALRTVPDAQLEAAKLDGVSAWARFVRIGLAQHRRALASAWIISFAFAFGELPASVLVAPPGVVTLPIQVFNRLHYGAEKEVAGICLVVLLIVAALTAIATKALRCSRRL